MNFRNWSGTHASTPSAWSEPQSEEEVAERVKGATRLRVVGAGHSFSGCVGTDGEMMSLDRMDRLVAVDPQRGVAVVQAGMRLDALNNALFREGLALPIVGSIGRQSIGGLLATATHGSSLRHGNMSSSLVAARLVDGTGTPHTFADGDDRLDGVRVSLGALGVLTEATLRVVRAFTVAEQITPMGFDDAVALLPELPQQAEYAKFWWFPHTNRALVFRGDRVDEPSTFDERFRRFDEAILNGVGFRALLWLGARAPALIPALNRLAAATFGARRMVGRSDRVLSLAMPPIHDETEWAVPVAVGPAVLRETRTLVERHRVNFILEARFVAADGGWMSPASGGDVMQIGVYTANPRDRGPLFDGFAAIARAHGGRPHWGKAGADALDPAEVRRMYPKSGRFIELARTLDPRGALRNPFTERILGPRTPAS